jgi:putative endopeptidase
MKRYLMAGTSLLAMLLVACSDGPSAETNHSDMSAPEIVQSAKLGSFGVSLQNMDESVNPGDNFFEYVNGTWLEDTEIPADRSRFGAFNVLSDQAEERVRGIIEAAASSDNPSSDEKRIADFYNAYLDLESIEAAGLSPIMDDLAQIRAANTRDDIADLMSNPALNLDAPASPYVYIDAKQNDEYRVYLTQSGLGLPNPNS